MNLSNLLQQLRTISQRYTLQQKLGLAGAGGIVLVMMWLLVHFANQVDYQVLYSDLDPQEAQGIVTKLQAAQVPYELSEDGRTIRVASDKISSVRIQLASEGLPESGRIGFEIFDRTNFGLTNFQEQVNYQRALEGELARSIMSLSEVAAARVHLVLAKETLYQSSEDQTKASVILKLKNGRSLAASSVQGIVNVVANSVKGLSPDKVTVIDYRGKVLSRTGGEGSLTGQQLDTRQKLETELAAKITQILEPAVGIGKVRPQVSIAMNFQQVEETVEQYDPQSSVIRSTQRLEERAPSAAPVGGIPGTRSNQQPAGAQGTSSPDTISVANQGNLLKQNETTNYEVSKAVRHIVNPVGRVERLSVAVIIDNVAKVVTGPDGQAQTTTEPRKPEEMKKYRDLVAAAIDLNAERGDQLIVENISFDSEAENIAAPTFVEKNGPLILTGLRYLIIPVVFLLLYILFLRPVQKSVFGVWATAGDRSLRAALPRPDHLQTPLTVKQLEAQLQRSSGAGSKDSYENTAERELLPLPSPTKMDVIRKRVVEHAQRDPETVARLVRVWLNDEKSK
jgi:flagellar M-ring protein FliF